MAQGKELRLVVGLGNPEEQYLKNRHNVGFWFAERIMSEAVFKLRKKLHSHCCDYNELLIAKPNVSMNDSGRAVAAIANYYRIEPQEIMVAHDELDFPAGAARLKFGGGAGGHNGVSDVISALGSEDFYRLRLGIGHPGSATKVNNFVLSNPGAGETKRIDAAIADVLDILPLMLQGMWSEAMNHLHTQD